MKRRDRRRLEAFVRARTDELSDDRLRRAHHALLAVTERLRREGTKEADWDWLEVTAGGFFGDDGNWSDDVADEAIFGDDPEAHAEAVTTDILLAMASAHDRHPDFDPTWRLR